MTRDRRLVMAIMRDFTSTLVGEVSFAQTCLDAKLVRGKVVVENVTYNGLHPLQLSKADKSA